MVFMVQRFKDLGDSVLEGYIFKLQKDLKNLERSKNFENFKSSNLEMLNFLRNWKIRYILKIFKVQHFTYRNKIKYTENCHQTVLKYKKVIKLF